MPGHCLLPAQSGTFGMKLLKHFGWPPNTQQPLLVLRLIPTTAILGIVTTVTSNGKGV